MARPPLSPTTKGHVSAFLHEGNSYSVIKKKMKQMGKEISRTSVSKIKKEMTESEKDQQTMKKNKKSKVRKSRKCHIFKKLNTSALRKLAVWTGSENHPTQTWMATKLGVTPSTIRYHIKHSLGKKLKKKPRVHSIWRTALLRRRTRAWKLYRRLSGGRYKSYITTDEAWFYLSNCNRDLGTSYCKKGSHACCTRRPPTHSPGLMAWAGISANGKTKIRWVEKGAKINSEYYVKNVLTPFLKEDAPSLYPEGNFIFHQDSAPAHIARDTVTFLESQGVEYIKEKEWIPCSPDAAPMDYGIWNWMKTKLRTRRVKTLKGLQKAVEAIWKELPQEQIDRVLKSWPSRVFKIYKAHGCQIEHEL